MVVAMIIVVAISPFAVAMWAFPLDKIVSCETLSQPSHVPLVAVGSLGDIMRFVRFFQHCAAA
jgi:hypothetical protein